METNADITVYNKIYDHQKRTDVWNRTVLLGVHKYLNANATQVNNAERRQDNGIFRVPASCPQYGFFLPEREYESVAHPEQFWTFRPEDIIVFGVCELEINGVSTLEANHIRPWKITSVSDNRRGTTPHIRARAE